MLKLIALTPKFDACKINGCFVKMNKQSEVNDGKGTLDHSGGT